MYKQNKSSNFLIPSPKQLTKHSTLRLIYSVLLIRKYTYIT